MREIKFRGKEIKSGDWVSGNLSHYPNEKDAMIESVSSDDKKVLVTNHFVDLDTIGQFTGLKDKNGVEVYEGDIIRKTETTYRMTDLGVVRYCNEEAKFVLHVTDKYGKYDLSFVKDFQSQDGNATVPCHNEYEVVGNIHDNPDLLRQ